MITSLDNIKIKDTSKLLKKKYRDLKEKFLIEGHHLVDIAKSKNLVVEIFTTDKNIQGTLVSEKVMKKITSTQTPQTIAAIVKKPKENKLGNVVLALNNIQDPGNLGTLIRTARAFAFSGILVQGTDIYNPKVIRSTQGALFDIPIKQVTNLSEHFDGYQIIGAVLDKEAKIYNKVQPSKKFILVLGNEGNGIEENIINLLNEKVYIPIEFESLNVASAGAIIMNEYSPNTKI